MCVGGGVTCGVCCGGVSCVVCWGWCTCELKCVLGVV